MVDRSRRGADLLVNNRIYSFFQGGSRQALWACGVFFACTVALQAAVFIVEEFTSDPSWGDRDADEMVVAWNGGFGNAAGSMGGTFASQGSPFAETDAMRITGGSSGGDFSGDLFGAYGGYGFNLASLSSGYFQFQFYSEDVLPSDLRFRINGGGFTYSRSLTSQASAVGGWQTISVSLAWGGWLGGTEANFQNVFSAVNFIDIQITRSGIGEQSYFVDNFGLGVAGDPPEPGDAIPEVATTHFLLVGVIFLASGVRRKLRKMALNLEG